MNKITKRVLIGSVAAVAVIAVSVYVLFFKATYQLQNTTYLYIDADDNRDSIRIKLQNTAHPFILWGYKLLDCLKPVTVHSGRYAIEPNEGQLATYRKLAVGTQSPVNLTIPSVRTIDKLAGVLGKKLMIDSTAILSALQDSAYCAALSYDTATIMALFIPNTYQVYWNISLDDFMKRMQKENKHFWNENNRSELAKQTGFSQNEIMTLASIVEEETANDAEKTMVAGMYINRLQQQMPLQADPTVKFALKDFSLRRIYHKHLAVNSPYNTYLHVGLPPGPIRIPRVVTIDAVLRYTKHNYLYMCAKEDFSGTHNFAATYAEHLQNARKYTQALNERSIK